MPHLLLSMLASFSVRDVFPDTPFLGAILTIGGYLIPIALVPHVLLSKREVGHTVAWILLIVLLPFVGAFLYWVLGHRRIARIQRRARGARLATRAVYDGAAVRRFDDPDLDAIASVTRKSGVAPALAGNAVRVLDDNRSAFEDMLEAIGRAERTVELEVFIFRPDSLGRRFLAALARAARRGVLVRLLVDGVGGFALGSRDAALLARAGGEVLRFLPVLRPRLRPRINFRLHRKLLVVDDRTCFLGSLNVGEELVGASPPWREVHLEIDGPAAAAAREAFEADWLFAGGKPRAPSLEVVPPQGDEVVQIVPSGPTDEESATARLLFAAISLAREEVLVATPYFVPGRRLLAALESAALRGVRVRIVLPGRTDMGIVFAATRYSAPALVEAGVSLRRLPGVMVHAKVAAIDSKLAIVGSANLDARSLGLSFELDALLFGRAALRARASVLAMLAVSEPFPSGPRGLPGKLLDACARVLSPVL